MQEFTVRLVGGSSMRVSADSLTEAEEIARKDGHRVEDWSAWARRVRAAHREYVGKIDGDCRRVQNTLEELGDVIDKLEKLRSIAGMNGRDAGSVRSDFNTEGQNAAIQTYRESVAAAFLAVVAASGAAHTVLRIKSKQRDEAEEADPTEV